LGKTATRGNDFEGGSTVSDEERKDLNEEAPDDDEGVEAHKFHGGSHMTDDGDDASDAADDVEAHKFHGGSH
jgi:hypothetical protein